MYVIDDCHLGMGPQLDAADILASSSAMCCPGQVLRQTSRNDRGWAKIDRCGPSYRSQKHVQRGNDLISIILGCEESKFTKLSVSLGAMQICGNFFYTSLTHGGTERLKRVSGVWSDKGRQINLPDSQRLRERKRR
jgi:hypothetical protein